MPSFITNVLASFMDVPKFLFMNSFCELPIPYVSSLGMMGSSEVIRGSKSFWTVSHKISK